MEVHKINKNKKVQHDRGVGYIENKVTQRHKNQQTRYN